MAALDWIFLTVLVASLLIGAWRGLVFELLSLAGWLAAFVAAQWFAAPVGAWLPMGETDAVWRHVAGFALVFVAVVFAVGLVTAVLRKLVHAVGLRPADRALGAVFGLLRGVVLLLALALVVGWMQMTDAPWWRQSRGATLLQQALAGLQPALPEGWRRDAPSW
ncbi:colicin V synthesis protein [Melaminivora suipulveris]|uniref:Colicin V synthesis protein n=1 Tax=Melaminivora suipulveris TaxID=2109913 RepID=A0A2R3QHD6_9BURK|nr:CvpA family protein [Melaminivora suipulveris]AVO51178.1 colicin V synthesis protein [Melaminivora suipulveris]